MIRRTLLNGMAGLALTGVQNTAFARGSRMKVGIVGAGIIGASLAYHLSDAGAEVYVFEKGRPAGGATEKSLAWINPHTANMPYMLLRCASMQQWRALDRRLGLGVIWRGSIMWTDSPNEASALRRKDQPYDTMPFAVGAISKTAFKEIDPAFDPGDLQAAVYTPGDGHVNPVAVTLKYLAVARQKGAKVFLACPVTDIQEKGGEGVTVVTSKGTFSFDRVIVAAGVDCPGVVSEVGYSLKLRPAPEVVTHSIPVPALSPVAYEGPEAVEFKQMADGQVVITAVSGMPNDLTNEAAVKEYGASILKKVSGYWPGLRGVDPGWVAVGYRPMPTDGMPIIGKIPGSNSVYLTVMHSGVTLSAIVGREVTNEVLLDRVYELFSPFRPERFMSR